MTLRSQASYLPRELTRATTSLLVSCKRRGSTASTSRTPAAGVMVEVEVAVEVVVEEGEEGEVEEGEVEEGEVRMGVTESSKFPEKRIFRAVPRPVTCA
ncbi:hypothetical protein FHG87_012309 [Trinorchestia longiramus]|nr:hypothetical protein FHG87_012309 [Trinorchestia longiramus]